MVMAKYMLETSEQVLLECKYNSFKSDPHLPEKIILFVSMKAL